MSQDGVSYSERIMIPSPTISEKLFPGRNLAQEWTKARPSKKLPPFLELGVRFDLARLQEVATNCMRTPGDFFPDHVATAFSEEAVEARPSEYCFGLLAGLSAPAKDLQDQLDQSRGSSWMQHHQTLTRRQVIRSLIELDENYNPVIDERNYTELRKDLAGTEIDRIRRQFRARCVRLRFAQLKAGESVRPHIDSSARYALRIIVPIFSNDQCLYGALVKSQKREWPLKPGHTYFVNGGYTHWARNMGTTDRIILILSLDGQQDWEWMHANHILPA